MNNDGIKNEKEIIEVLDEKPFIKIPPFWKKLLVQMFGEIKPNQIILCRSGETHEKADIYIIANRTKRSVSIKSGNQISVHTESANRFCGFLKSLHIEEEYTDFLKLYHYGDLTLDGTGDIRLNLKEIQERYVDKIKSFNKRIKKDPNVLKRAMHRFLSIGTPNVDCFCFYLYYGNKYNGYCIRIQYLIEFFLKHIDDYNCYDNRIHFGPFIYEPKYRGLNNFDVDKKGRYYCIIKWPHAIEQIKLAILEYKDYPL